MLVTTMRVYAGLPFILRCVVTLVALVWIWTIPSLSAGDTLPGTQALTWEGDVASRMIDGIDHFLLHKIEQSVAEREKYWQRDLSSAEAYARSIEPNRRRLAHLLGVRDERVAFESPEFVATTQHSGLVGKGETYEIYAIRWPVLEDPHPLRTQVTVYGEGLLIVPSGDVKSQVDVIVIPDADQLPEQLVGLAEGAPLVRELVAPAVSLGCRVIIPTLINRTLERRNGRANLTSREYLYRPAFELGRHIIGYELQKVLACIDWFERDAAARGAVANIAVMGYGEGGMLALYAAALDTRIDALCVSGYVGNRNTIWQQPIDRNVFGLLREFGDGELISMVLPRACVVGLGGGPDLTLPGEGGAPAHLEPAAAAAGKAEVDRGWKLLGERQFQVTAGNTIGEGGSLDGPSSFADLAVRTLNYAGHRPEDHRVVVPDFDLPEPFGTKTDAAARQKRQLDQIDLHNELLLAESPFVRREFMKELDTSSLEGFERTIEPYRRIFREDVIGAFDDELLPPSPRTRKAHQTEKWTAYEVVLDVYPGVFAYGYLLLPKDLKLDGSERRPVVVCQHGLEGRPTDTFLGDHGAYHDFAAKLAERGFITFAPQNLYIFEDRFRTLQRKANPLGKSLFSIIVPQHQQIVDWLQSLPFVDPQRVAFYGLSYGGKTAMRVPALVTDYCLAICSADFNEWVLKNASTRHPFSYVWTGEYEIFEWDLGSTFNYAEMAALICPRPFMVERGHFDGVGWDEYVAFEFAKVRNLYQAQLGIGDRTEIEWFVGPHTIHGKGSYDFLHRHLNWPAP